MDHWLGRHGVVAEPVDERTRCDAVELREAIRCLLRHNAGHPLDPAAGVTLRRIGAEHPLVVHCGEEGGVRLVPLGDGRGSVLGRVLATMAGAVADGSWARLKSCQEDVCGWAFYDRSPGGTGRWCSMAVCGSRAKMRAYRGRIPAAG